MKLRNRALQLWSRLSNRLDDYPSLQAVPYWLAAFLVGLVAVGYTWLFHVISEFSRHLVDTYHYWMLLVLPFGFVLAHWLVRKFAFLAVGSGIPQVMGALELTPEFYDKKLRYLLGVRTVVTKIASSLSLAFAGAAAGPEGPTIQICAGLFHSFGKRFQRIWPQIGHESLILAGGAAGVAAAFNTPLGGIVFAIEELSHNHFHKVKTALISAVIIAGLVAQWIKGPYLMFGYPPLRTTGQVFFLWAIAIGIATGMVGALFSKLVLLGAKSFARFKAHEKLLFSYWVGLAIVAYACYFGSHCLGSGISLVSDLLFKPEYVNDFSVTFARIVFPIFSYMAGGAAGLMAPALAAGAAMGRQFNDLLSVGYPNLMVLLGMIGFLAAFTRAPFTAFVLVLEMTDRHSAIFFMMVTSLVASAVSRSFGGHSLYEDRKEFYLSMVNQAVLAPTSAPEAAVSAENPPAEERKE